MKKKNKHDQDIEQPQQDVNAAEDAAIDRSQQDINAADADENATDEEAEKQDSDSQSQTADSQSQAEPAVETDPLDIALTEIASLKDKYLRTVAEFENYKRRTLKEKTELILNGSEKTVDAILPVVDDMERALDTNTKTDDIEAVKEGQQLIYHKLMKTLEGLGVKAIETDDQLFDVDFHEAVAMVPGMGDDNKGKIIDCIQKGYTLNGKVIRHAKVAVGQ